MNIHVHTQSMESLMKQKNAITPFSDSHLSLTNLMEDATLNSETSTWRVSQQVAMPSREIEGYAWGGNEHHQVR